MVGVVAFWLCFFCLCCTHIDLLVVQGLNFGVNGTISGERRGGEYGYYVPGTFKYGDETGLKQSSTVASILGDQIVQSAYMDGVFIPDSKIREKYNIFTSKEAINCLKDKKVIITGDSYMNLMYVGLADILLNKPENYNMHGHHERAAIDHEKAREIRYLYAHNNGTGYLLWNSDCYGLRYPLGDNYPTMNDRGLANLTMCADKIVEQLSSVDIFAASFLIHTMHDHAHHKIDPGSQMLDMCQEDILGFFRTITSAPAYINNLIWASPPAYGTPMKYTVRSENIANEKDITWSRLVAGMMEHDGFISGFGVPVMDFHSLTGSCTQANCTFPRSGAHRSRYVNRAKAQVFLNAVCGDQSQRKRKRKTEEATI